MPARNLNLYDENSENNFASVKTEYTYPEYADNKTSNRIESYSNTITYGTDSTDENRKSLNQGTVSVKT